MIDLFTFRLIFSFLIGAVWIVFLTILSEKFGTKIGGAIAGIPATMVVALFFIGYTQSPEIASQSTTLIPLMLGINALFVVLFISLSRINFYLSLITSLVIWFIISFIIILLGFNNFIYSIVLYIPLIFFSYYILEKKLIIKSQEKIKIKYNFFQIILRGVIGGLTIFIAVFLAKIGGPLIGGIFASFPALTIALILILYFSHGIAFSAALLKNFIISGTLNVLIFIISIRYTYLYLGLTYGTLISFFISLIMSYLNYNFINKKLS